jgi:hypothetical protein
MLINLSTLSVKLDFILANRNEQQRHQVVSAAQFVLRWPWKSRTEYRLRLRLISFKYKQELRMCMYICIYIYIHTYIHTYIGSVKMSIQLSTL